MFLEINQSTFLENNKTTNKAYKYEDNKHFNQSGKQRFKQR